MARRFILAALLFAGLPGSASAGWWETGNPGGDELHGAPQAHPISAPGPISGFKVIHRDGRAIRVPRGQRHGAPAPRHEAGRPAQPSPVMR